MREERVKVGERLTLARERRIRARAWRGKGGLHGERTQIPKRKGGQGLEISRTPLSHFFVFQIISQAINLG